VNSPVGKSHLVSGLIEKIGEDAKKIDQLKIDAKDKSLADLRELINDEISELSSEITRSSATIRSLILASMDAEDYFSEEKLDARIEVRAGVGGDEALKWANELFDMYAVVAARNGWNWQESDPVEGSSIFKAVVGGSGSSILGPYGFLRFESGVHRVQRVPFNSDRMQTSAAAVVVLPKIEIPEIRLKDSEIKISISKKSSGAGGQSVNAAYQQVTLKHLPTGFTVTCADSHAQQENKEMAYTRLRQRVQEFEEEKVLASLAKTRKSQATTADRSEKIRTYNFQRGEVNDHRVSGCVVKEDVGEFMGDGESLVDIIWGKLVENAENEAISNLFK
jgi:peptide chain release factor 1